MHSQRILILFLLAGVAVFGRGQRTGRSHDSRSYVQSLSKGYTKRNGTKVNSYRRWHKKKVAADSPQ